MLALGIGSGAGAGGSFAPSSKLAAVIVSKDGTRTPYVASDDTDAARGVALTSAIMGITDGQTLVCSPGNYYMATTNLLLVEGCTYIWNGARLYIDGSSTGRPGGETNLNRALLVTGNDVAPNNVGNYQIIGPLTIDLGGVSDRRGIWCIKNGGGILIQGVRVVNIGSTSHGISMFSPSGAIYFGNRISDCFAGSVTASAGQGFHINSEYWAVSNCVAYNCGTGFYEAGGNTTYSNCITPYCTIGLGIYNTSNPGHGTWTGGNFNHATTGVYTDPNITAAFGGWSFSGAIAHSTRFDLNGKGITWTGGEIANTTFVSTGANAGVSQFHNVRTLSTSTSESTSLAALSASERANLKFRNCRDELGALVTWNDYVDAAYVAKTANYTITGADRTIDVTANSPTITLPTAVNCAGRQYIIANTGAGTITVATTSGQTVDGAAPATILTTVRRRYESDGANWITW